MQTTQMNVGRRYALMHKILNKKTKTNKFIPMIILLLLLLFRQPTLNFIRLHIYFLEFLMLLLLLLLRLGLESDFLSTMMSGWLTLFLLSIKIVWMEVSSPGIIFWHQRKRQLLFIFPLIVSNFYFFVSHSVSSSRTLFTSFRILFHSLIHTHIHTHTKI